MVARPQESAPSLLGICREESAAGAAIIGCSRKGILYPQFLIQRSTRDALVEYLQASVMTQYNKR